MVDDREVLLDYYTNKSEHIDTGSNSCCDLNIMSNSYIFNSFPRGIKLSSSTEVVFNNQFNMLFVDPIPLVTNYMSVQNSKTFDQNHLSYEQSKGLAVNDDSLPITKDTRMNKLCPTSSSVIFSHNDSKPIGCNFYSMGNNGISSEVKYTCSLNPSQIDNPLPVKQLFIYDDLNNIKSHNSNVYSQGKELTNRDSFIDETYSENFLHELNSLPLNLSKSSNRVCGNLTAICTNCGTSNPTATSNSIVNKEFNLSNSLNPYNLQHFPNCSISCTFPFDISNFDKIDKSIIPLEVDMTVTIANDGVNSISQDEVRSSFPHAQLLNNQPEQNIDQKSLSIESQSKCDEDKTINKSCNAWEKRKSLKETKYRFGTDFSCNGMQELNGKAFPESGCSFESISPEPNICSSLHPMETKSVKVTHLFKDSLIHDSSSYRFQRVKSVLPDLNVRTKVAKAVSKKCSSSLAGGNYEALQKSTRIDEKTAAQRKGKKSKSKYGKMSSDIPKQHSCFSSPSVLLAENVHDVQRNKTRKKSAGTRNNLNAFEIRSFQSASKDQSVNDKNILATKEELVDSVKQYENINPSEKLLNIRNISRHKILRATSAVPKKVTSSKICKNSTKGKNHETTNSRQAAKTLRNVLTKDCKKKLKTCRKTCNIVCQIKGGDNDTENHTYGYNDIYYKPDGSCDLIKDYTGCYNGKRKIRNTNFYTATLSSNNNNIKNYTLPNYSFNMSDNIGDEGFEVLHENDGSELTNIIQSSLILDRNDNCNVFTESNRYNEPVYMLIDSSTLKSDEDVKDSNTALTHTDETSDVQNESGFIITDVFSLSGFWNSIFNEVPYIEDNCWKLSS